MNDLQAYYENTYLSAVKKADAALLLKVKEAISEMTFQTAVLSYEPDAATAIYKGGQFTVEALSIRNGHMVVRLKGYCGTVKETVPIKNVTFDSIPVLIRNVIAATRFPENLRRKAETFYEKPVSLFGQTLRITGYIRRENCHRHDFYVFRLNNGDPIALTASQIKQAAKQVQQSETV